MIFRVLKRYFPRTLYGRSVLILILPMIVIQLVVSVIFVQRHFQGVSEQLVLGSSGAIGFVQRSLNEAPDLAAGVNEIIEDLDDLRIVIADMNITEPQREFFDLTGLVINSELHRRLDGVIAVDFVSAPRMVLVAIETVHGPVTVMMPRGLFSARNPHQLLLWLVFFGVIMTMISFAFLRNQMRSITRLSYAAEAFGKGEIVKYTPAGAAEVRAAGTAFLSMRARIERQIEQRTMMLSGVSHDMRTPLTRLRLGLTMIEDEADVADLLRDTHDLEALLDGFLDFARDDAGDAWDDVVPHAMLSEAVDKATRIGGHVLISAASDATEIAVRMRAQAVRRAIDNLIGNALRYADSAMVSVSVSERAVVFSVEDDGPGIPPEAREDAMKPFQRLDAARNQNKGAGVGLGLAIAADVARRHGGALRLGVSPNLGGLRADLVIARHGGRDGNP